MRRILHILTEADGRLADAVIDAQKAETGIQVNVRDITQGDIDYDELLEAIFEADSVQVW